MLKVFSSGSALLIGEVKDDLLHGAMSNHIIPTEKGFSISLASVNPFTENLSDSHEPIPIPNGFMELKNISLDIMSNLSKTYKSKTSGLTLV
jgi:hypothetical protein